MKRYAVLFQALDQVIVEAESKDEAFAEAAAVLRDRPDIADFHIVEAVDLQEQ